MISLIAAIGQNNELGKNGDLIWPLKKDLKFFREVTWGHEIIMGRKTFDSLPHLLENRKHIVVSRNQINVAGVITCNDINALIEEYQDRDAFVIGGASMYESFIEYAEKIYLTHIEETDSEADTFFPNFDIRKFDRLPVDEDIEDGILFRHVLYKRRK